MSVEQSASMKKICSVRCADLVARDESVEGDER